MRKEDVKIGMRVYFMFENGDIDTEDPGTVEAIGYDCIHVVYDLTPDIKSETRAKHLTPVKETAIEAGSTVQQTGQQTVYMDEPPFPEKYQPKFKVGDRVQFVYRDKGKTVCFGTVIDNAPIRCPGTCGVAYDGEAAVGVQYSETHRLSLVEEPVEKAEQHYKVGDLRKDKGYQGPKWKNFPITKAVEAFKDLVPGLYKTNKEIAREKMKAPSYAILPELPPFTHPEHDYYLEKIRKIKEASILSLKHQVEYDAKQKLCDCGNLPHFKFCKAFDKRYDY